MNMVHVRNVDYAFGLNRVLTSNSTQTGGFAALAPTTTKPTVGPATGVYDLTQFQAGLGAPRYCRLIGFGKNAADLTFSVRVVGWSLLGSLWVPYTMAEIVCTLGALTGVSGSTDLSSTELLADTMSITTGTSGTDLSVISPADNTVAHALLDLKGARLLQFQINRGGSATEANALFGIL